jgi:2-polyprenyl-6-methoxyphenol hydroxylase-like FAD-dependent oxidoreductase
LNKPQTESAVTRLDRICNKKPLADLPVLIAGGGIGGLTLALTLQQIGVPCIVFESVTELKPLGVGINLQPNAVRELYELGIGPSRLDRIGIQSKEWALVGLNGNDVYAESRGLLAGYKWPQYSVHRGQLQMLLYQTAVERLGSDAIRTGMELVEYRNTQDGVSALLRSHDGRELEFAGALLIGADGIDSAVRARMHPDQPPIHWGGAIMWRGTTPGVPVRTGASFVGLGTHRHRVVFYPISQPDPDSGLATINWIAELTVDSAGGWSRGDWNRRVGIDSFIHHFDGWNYEWLDVGAMIRGASEVFENPMIDRDPVSTWVDGHVALLCDAALCEEISALVLRNRGSGPFGLLNLLDHRCGGVFDDIDDVIPRAEREEFMSRYKAAAGFAIDKLNAAPSIIEPGARARPAKAAFR